MNNNGNNKIVIDCPFCKQRFRVTMPTSSQFNDLKVSGAIASHEKPVRCICGKKFVFAIGRIQIQWTLVPITEEQAGLLEESKLVLPPPGIKIA